MMVFKAAWFALCVLATSEAFGQSGSTKPAVPPGIPARGFAVAVVLSGVDYTKAGVALRLARDGEGVAIAYDAVDDDARPYEAAAANDNLIATAPTLVVPVRVDASVESWTRAFAFIRRSPARVVVVLSVPPDAALAREAAATSDRLLLVPATSAAKLAMPNVLTVAALPSAGGAAVQSAIADLVLAPAAASREAPSAAVAIIAGPVDARAATLLASGLFGCIDVSKARSPADVVKVILAKGARGPVGSAPLVEVCGRR